MVLLITLYGHKDMWDMTSYGYYGVTEKLQIQCLSFYGGQSSEELEKTVLKRPELYNVIAEIEVNKGQLYYSCWVSRICL